MAHETEIKLRIGDAAGFRKKLKKLGARPVTGGTGRVHEWNVIFDTPERGLAKHGQLLRIRTETPAAKSKQNKPASRLRTLLTFKRPFMDGSSLSGNSQENHRHKVREEFEIEETEGGVLTKIFEGLGMPGWFHYEKSRTTFRLPAACAWAKGLLIELD